MQRQDDDRLESEPAPQPKSEKRPYEAPKVEAVQLSKEAAESLT